MDRTRSLGVETPGHSELEKLTGIDAYKPRPGNYRIVYEISDVKKEIRVVILEDRKQVYQRLRRKK